MERLGIPEEHLHPFGRYKAKLSLDYCEHVNGRPDGKLVLVTAMSPTPAGEGKTTMTVGLGDALNRIGKKAIICLREPALGPVFGMKGGAAGGGYAQVVPMEDINLHFTGDFPAIAIAHNLLAALIDNHVHWGNAPDLTRGGFMEARRRRQRPGPARDHVGLGGLGTASLERTDSTSSWHQRSWPFSAWPPPFRPESTTGPHVVGHTRDPRRSRCAI